jgi:hypothetical protein
MVTGADLGVGIGTTQLIVKSAISKSAIAAKCTSFLEFEDY